MSFRAATTGDMERLLALQAAYYRADGYVHHPSAARRAWTELLSDERLGRVWVLEADAGVVGYIVVTYGYSLEYLGRDAFVDELYLAEAYRGQGLGRAALDVAESACREAGVWALHLEVEANKSDTVELYRRGGFTDHGRYLMTKRLIDAESAE